MTSVLKTASCVRWQQLLRKRLNCIYCWSIGQPDELVQLLPESSAYSKGRSAREASVERSDLHLASRAVSIWSWPKWTWCLNRCASPVARIPSFSLNLQASWDLILCTGMGSGRRDKGAAIAKTVREVFEAVRPVAQLIHVQWPLCYAPNCCHSALGSPPTNATTPAWKPVSRDAVATTYDLHLAQKSALLVPGPHHELIFAREGCEPAWCLYHAHVVDFQSLKTI